MKNTCVQHTLKNGGRTREITFYFLMVNTPKFILTAFWCQSPHCFIVVCNCQRETMLFMPSGKGKPITMMKRLCCANCYKSDLFQSRIIIMKVFTPLGGKRKSERSMLYTFSLNLLLSTAHLTFSFRIFVYMLFYILNLLI